LVLEFLGAALNNDKDIIGVQIESIEFLLSNLRFSYYHWLYSSAGGLLVPEAIISPVVSDLAMLWFNIYMYY
jgi:hypothetical protein